MHNLKTIYNKILEVLKSIEPKNNFIFQKHKPKLTDKELLALSITSEYLGIDSEYDLFRKLPFSLSSKIERSVYNKRRRKLFLELELMRSKLAYKFNQDEKYFIVGSMPLEVCKISRASRNSIYKEQNFSSPNRGYCAYQDTRYYGYKLPSNIISVGSCNPKRLLPLCSAR